MSKTNFTKVEESLKKGMEKLAIKKIIDSTDQEKEQKQAKEEERLNRKKVVIYLITELKRLHKIDAKIYGKLGTSLASAKKLLENPIKLSDEDWNVVLKLKQKLESYKKAYAATIKEDNMEEMVEKQRSKQADRRFNIQDEWLPVD